MQLNPTRTVRCAGSLNMTLQIHRLLISLAFLVCAVTCLPASAGDYSVNQGPSTRVKAGNLDLNTDAGRHELLDRLSKAASSVCAEYATANWSLGYAQVYRSCFQSTLAAAVDKIHHEQVSALFRSSPPPRS
jgi:UrcA family protein